MRSSLTTIATLALLLACAGSGTKDGHTSAAEACDQACTGSAQGDPVRYVGGMLCGERWTCRCALPGEPEESVCDPIVRVGVISATRVPTGGATIPSSSSAGEAVVLMSRVEAARARARGGHGRARQDYATHLDTLLAAYGLAGVPRVLTVGETDVSGAAEHRRHPQTPSPPTRPPGSSPGSCTDPSTCGRPLRGARRDLPGVEPATHFGLGTGTFNRNGYVPRAERDWLAADLAATKLPTVIFLHPGTGVWNTESPRQARQCDRR